VSVAEFTSNGVSLSIDVNSLEAGAVRVLGGRPKKGVLIVSFSVGCLPADLDFLFILGLNGGCLNESGTGSKSNGGVIVRRSNRFHAIVGHRVSASSNSGGSSINEIAFVENGGAVSTEAVSSFNDSLHFEVASSSSIRTTTIDFSPLPGFSVSSLLSGKLNPVSVDEVRRSILGHEPIDLHGAFLRVGEHADGDTGLFAHGNLERQRGN